MTIRVFLNTVLILLVCSCTSYSDDMEAVLRQAGKNRMELEKVLKYYSNNPADSLKLKAAEFLILNIPGKYSVYYDAPWNDVATVMLRWTSSSNRQLVLDTYKIGDKIGKYDITHITGDFLINNIELAFKVWEEMPWGKDVPFDVFCEEILPYRVDIEPLENWREKALASFADLYNGFRNDTTGITAIEACCQVNDILPRFKLDNDYPPMSFSQLMASARGTCANMAALAVFSMRALGIPVTCDFTPLWPGWNRGHSWNSVRESSGDHISFMGAQSNPGEPHSVFTTHKCKIYRYTYAKQKHVMTDKSNIPSKLHDVNQLIDVTSEYCQTADVRLPAMNSHLSQTGYAFLTIPYQMDWIPVSWGIAEDDSIHFFSLGKSNIYMPVYYNHDVQSAASYPFSLNEDLICRIFRPDSTRSESLSIYPRPDLGWKPKMRGGRFEVANRSDFSDARTIYKIETDDGPYFHTVSIRFSSAYRYVRYVSPVGKSCDVSILEFYDENNNQLQGSIIGESSNGWYKQSSNYEKAFDGDVDTYVRAMSDDAWTGLDFYEPKRPRRLWETHGGCRDNC